MAFYHVEVGYRFKKRKTGEAVGMTVEAFGPDEAEEMVRERYVDKYPSRIWVFTKIREATPSDMALGIANH